MASLNFSFGRKRGGIGIIDYIKIRDDTQNALLFFELDLLDGDLIRGRKYRYQRYIPFNLQPAIRQKQDLAWFECDHSRSPRDKTLGTDGNVIGDSRFKTSEFKESAILFHALAMIVGDVPSRTTWRPE